MAATLFVSQSAITEKFRNGWLKRVSTDLYWILTICAVCRIIYYSALQKRVDDDSPSYLNYAGNMLNGRIDVFRTPVYPYFIKIARIFGEKNLVDNIIILQCVISFLAVGCFFGVVKYLFKSRKATVLSTLFFGLALPVINFDKVIRTESLSISLMVFFLALIAGYMRRPGAYRAFYISISVFILVMLRPSFVVLLPGILLFWIGRYRFNKNEKWPCISGLLMLGVVVLLLIGYSSMNNRQNGYYGLSTVNNINQLDIVIDAGIYDAGNDSELVGFIKSQLVVPEQGGKHWQLLWRVDNKYNANRISAFIASCIKAEPVKYIKNILRSELYLEHQNVFTRYPSYKQGVLRSVFIRIESMLFYIPFNFMFIFLSCNFLFFFRKQNGDKNNSLFQLVLWFMVVAQVVTAIVGAREEYQRLIVTVLPAIIIMVFYWFDRYCTVSALKLMS